jgi:hypothetical protein
VACTKHFLKTEWEHHAWHRRVSSSEHVPSQQTDMWGRRITDEFVRCDTQQVCEVCGRTRDAGTCLCDSAQAERCRVRLAWIDATAR